MQTTLIKTTPHPNQTFSFVIDKDRYTVDLNTRLGKLYASVSSEKQGDIVYNRVCLNKVPITGNLVFYDIDGNDDPTYSELNARFFLVWFQR